MPMEKSCHIGALPGKIAAILAGFSFPSLSNFLSGHEKTNSLPILS
jgi:hypothetical protein